MPDSSLGLVGVIGLIGVLGGCHPHDPPRAPIPPVSAGKVRVRVFTEPSPVRQLTSAGRFVFVATNGDLERWDVDGGVLPLSAEHGLSGSQIVALAPDVDRRWVWILTEAGLGHYDVSAEQFQPMLAPPSTINIDFGALAKEGASVAPAADGGAWLGTARGLVYVGADGMWSASTLRDPIHGLARDHAGWLWIATKAGLVARKPTGELVRIGAAQGFGIADPRLLVELPGDRMLVIGADDGGRDRIAFGKQLQWSTYRALPDVKWDAAARRGTGAVMMAGDRVYLISPADPNRVRPLARDGMRLAPMASGHVADWVIDPIDLVVPPGAITLASVDDQLLIGTRDLGTARYRDGEPRPHDWLRRRQMFLDATTLSVACAKVSDCWIATGTKQAWHWTGEGFVPGGPDDVVLAMVRDPAGPLYALHRAPSETTIRVSRISGDTWTPLPKLAITTVGTEVEINFARFASSGTLWIGLRGEGIAIIEPATGKVAYHRNGEHEGKQKPLPIPNDIVDGDVRGDVTWFATGQGVARLANGKLETWTEEEGLRTGLTRAVAIAADGSVYIATGAGAGRWDGKAWEFPTALSFDINDVVATRNGQVWMATERGIVAWDGHKVRRVDTRRGLAENVIIDVATDQFDRVWARGSGSLTLISQ
ncbi:MAG: hypothetical protein ABI867_07515 [Kofleriaceae bacterium]